MRPVLKVNIASIYLSALLSPFPTPQAEDDSLCVPLPVPPNSPGFAFVPLCLARVRLTRADGPPHVCGPTQVPPRAQDHAADGRGERIGSRAPSPLAELSWGELRLFFNLICLAPSKRLRLLLSRLARWTAMW